MARGNERDLARARREKEKNKRKSGTNKSGTQMQQDNETAAEIMRRKQAASDARKAAAGLAGKK
ncbi:hypothetical protein FPRO03_06703 [Fusarium proliferatum]|nr:hypothetical protein FPRO03_06703 [Fusarium proliferatum]